MLKLLFLLFFKMRSFSKNPGIASDHFHYFGLFGSFPLKHCFGVSDWKPLSSARKLVSLVMLWPAGVCCTPLFIKIKQRFFSFVC